MLFSSFIYTEQNKNGAIGPSMCWGVLMVCILVSKQQFLIFFFAGTRGKRMIEINLCVLRVLSRGNQSWLNCSMTSISVWGNSSCYLIWLHNRVALSWDCFCHSVEIEKCNIFVNDFFFPFQCLKDTHSCWMTMCTGTHTHTSLLMFNITKNTNITIKIER